MDQGVLAKGFTLQRRMGIMDEVPPLNGGEDITIEGPDTETDDDAIEKQRSVMVATHSRAQRVLLAGSIHALASLIVNYYQSIQRQRDCPCAWSYSPPVDKSRLADGGSAPKSIS